MNYVEVVRVSPGGVLTGIRWFDCILPMLKQLPPHLPEIRVGGDDGWADDFVERLDQKLQRSNRKKWQRLLAWGEVLDAAGWCVALPNGIDGIWLSANARRDLEARGGGAQCLPSGTRSEGGVHIWAGPASEALPMPPPVGLTAREHEVFDWLRAGKSDSEVAMILGCAVRTVEKHVANLYRKLGVATRAAAILHPTAPAR